MRHTLSVRIPLAEHNAGKRIGWNSLGQARDNYVSECFPCEGDFLSSKSGKCKAAPESVWEGGRLGCADGDEEAGIWDLVRFLVTTE